MASRGKDVGLLRLRAHDGDLAPRALLLDQVRELHAGEEPVHGLVEIRPQVVGHAALVLVAVLAAAALRGIDALLDRADDVGDGDLARVAREVVAAARPANALDQLAPAQLPEQLLEVRERDLLPRADAGERDRAVGGMQREVEHRGDRESSLGRESHGLPRWRSPKTRAIYSSIGNPTEIVKNSLIAGT